MIMVLVVGERPEQANALAESLGILGIEAVASAKDWKLATRALVAHRISLILIDVDRSEESKTFFDTMRDLSALPILVRGPMSKTDLIISYLERGAIDYCGRTTPPIVLAAKIQSFVRSEPAAVAADTIVCAGDLAIDLGHRRVLKGSTEISLTPIEFRLLSVLAENFGRPCTHKELLEHVWGKDVTHCAHYVRLYIGYLRQKLEDNPARPRLLINEWGYGYRLTEPKPTRKKLSVRAALRLVQG